MFSDGFPALMLLLRTPEDRGRLEDATRGRSQDGDSADSIRNICDASERQNAVFTHCASEKIPLSGYVKSDIIKRQYVFTLQVSTYRVLALCNRTTSVLPREAKRQYLLTSQVSRYCLSALQSSIYSTHQTQENVPMLIH